MLHRGQDNVAYKLLRQLTDKLINRLI